MKSLIALTVLSTSIAAAQAIPDKPQPKFFTPVRIALFSADALVRTLDAQSTNANLFNPCKCYKEDTIPAITGTKSGMIAYSLAVPVGVMAASYLAHRLHHEKLATLFPMIDIAVEAPAVAKNYQIAGHK